TQTVKADSDQSLSLQATNGKDTVSQAKGILLMRPPEITSFTADPPQSCPGCAVTLRWSTSRAERVLLDGTTLPSTDGTLTVKPNASTEYVLSAENALGSVQGVLTVNVAAGVATPTAVGP
ncbi:MAG: hypothetical protein M3328_14765, partial [Chloroflexota bacterium]|nr:hypothetical protein [Chloroflexota bacterium]